MASEWLRIGEKTIEIRPRPDDPNGERLNELLNLHLTCERVREVRLGSVHAVAFASALALADKIADALLPDAIQRNIELGWDLAVLWTAMIMAIECYWRWRWNRSAAPYVSRYST